MVGLAEKDTPLRLTLLEEAMSEIEKEGQLLQNKRTRKKGEKIFSTRR